MRVLVRVSTNANSTAVGGRYGDAEPPVLIVRVTARAIDGKANAATIEALAQAFGLPRGKLRLVSGHRSRTKVVDMQGADAAVLKSLLVGP